MDVVGPAGRTGRDCALFPYIRKASQSLLSGSRGPVCELVSGSAEGARPGGCSVLRSSACGREQQTPQRGRNTDLQVISAHYGEEDMVAGTDDGTPHITQAYRSIFRDCVSS